MQVKITSSKSLSEAYSGRTSSGTFTDRTSPRCECVGGSSVTAWRTPCLYGVTYSLASPRLLLGIIFVSNILRVAHYLLTMSYLLLKVPDFP